MNVTRILKDTPATVTTTIYRDGSATDIGTVTVTATKADGTALFTDSATTDGGDGTYQYTFTDEQTATLNFLTLVWTEASGESHTTYVEIVGGHLFTISEARTFDGSAMNNGTTYPNADIVAERDRITDNLEKWTGVSWVPRFRRWSTSGDGTRELILPDHRINELLSASIGGTSQSVGDINIDSDNGILWHTGQVFTSSTDDDPYSVTVEYEHGYQYIKNGVDRIALTLLRNRLVRSNVGDRVISRSDDTGFSERLAVAGPRFQTGYPEVDRWLMDNDERLRFA